MKFHEAARIAVYGMIPTVIGLEAAHSIWSAETILRAEVWILIVLIPLHVLGFGKRWVRIFRGEL